MANPPDELLDHDYDGIREFDNPLPRWWVYLFYFGIVFAIAYVPYYHFGSGQLPREIWAEDMSAWWDQHPPPELPSHEELEAMAQDPTFVQSGEAIYKVRCISCHAMDGGGLVGPNLTDDYTVYGYGRDQIVAVVYHGTKNGMLAWKDQLSLDEIYQVGAYVHTLRGKTPAKPKAPDGVPIVDGEPKVADAATAIEGEEGADAAGQPETPSAPADPEATPPAGDTEGAPAEPAEGDAPSDTPPQVPGDQDGATDPAPTEAADADAPPAEDKAG